MDARVRELVRSHGYDLREDQVWLTATPAGFDYPAEGWKLHVSTRVTELAALVEVLVPVLVARRCAFKLARSAAVLEELNDGYSHPASVGKAVTVYPRPDDVRELGLLLAEHLSGHEGPPVVSDRRVAPGAPVYYRYGPMRAGRPTLDAHGHLGLWLTGPGGERFDALAGLRYRRPGWARDPFADGTTVSTGVGLLGGRYRVADGIREAAPGNVYRCTDERDGGAVVVKQARPFVGERLSAPGQDGRLRLRNERRVLLALDGIAGVPRFVDHFAQGGDEFLVTGDRGGRSLDEDVRAAGPYSPARVLALGRRLARVLHAVHERGVVMRDLTPANVVLDGTEVSIVDFGIAAHDGVHLPGHTPGYAPDRQVRGAPPRDLDDLHALGMTLAFAATGHDPVDVGGDQDVAALRTRQLLARLGEPPVWAELVSGDEAAARAAFDRLRTGEPAGPPSTVVPAPPNPAVADVVDAVRADLLHLLDEVLRPPYRAGSEHDLNLHGGLAGVGLELLRHLADDAVRDRLPDVVAFLSRGVRQVPVSPGLMTGRTGIAVFLTEAAAHGFDVPEFEPLDSGWADVGADLTDGAAGIGLGHVRLHRTTGNPAHLAVAADFARVVEATPDPESLVPQDKRLTAVDGSAGSAHGLAGLVELLLAHEPRGAATGHRAHALAERTRRLLTGAADPAADPLAASWCQGLAGIGRTLQLAGRARDEPWLTELGVEAVDEAARLAPRLATLGLCCGIAGVGNALLTTAVLNDSDRHRTAAHDLFRVMLLRSGGSDTHPVFVSRSSNTRAVSWAGGLAGILGFLRRLADERSPDPVPC